MLWKQHPVFLVTLGKVSTFIALTMQQNLSAPASVSGLDENAIFNKGHTNVPKANSESGSFCPGKMVTCLTQINGYLTGRVGDIWWKLRNSHHSENRTADRTVSR